MALEGIAKLGFVDFWDYFGRFSTLFRGIIYEMLILSPEKELKIGQNNPKNRQNLVLQCPL